MEEKLGTVERTEMQRGQGGGVGAGHICMTVLCFSKLLSVPALADAHSHTHTCKMTQMLTNCSTLSVPPSSLMCIYMKISSCLLFQY